MTSEKHNRVAQRKRNVLAKRMRETRVFREKRVETKTKKHKYPLMKEIENELDSE